VNKLICPTHHLCGAVASIWFENGGCGFGFENWEVVGPKSSTRGGM